MIFADVFVAAVFAAIFTVVFAGALRGYRFGAIFLWFFVILFFLTWAGGIWVAPIGTPLFGVFWFTFFVTGLVFSVLLAAMLPASAKRRKLRLPTEPHLQEDRVTFDVVAWIAVCLLAIAILYRYVSARPPVMPVIF